MIPGIIGRKIGMSRLFTEDGLAEGVTLIQAGPCVVTQIKTEARDGYKAIQLGFGKAKKSRSSQTSDVKGVRFSVYREFRVSDEVGAQVGDTIDVSFLQPGDRVSVTGVSKGRGFAGVVKRHGFAGGPKTHGQSDRHRAPGSIGATTSPGRVVKGRRMAGHMGNHTVTVRNLKVIAVEPSRNILVLGGAVPGATQGLLVVRKATKRVN